MKIGIPEVWKLETDLENEAVDCFNFLRRDCLSVLLSICESTSHDLKHERLKSPSPELESAFK